MEKYRNFSIGLITAVGYLIYFLMMQLFGLAQNIELRGLNFFILMAGIIYSIHLSKISSYREFNYYNGFTAGVTVTVVSVVSFSMLMFIYLQFVNPHLMRTIQETEALGRYMDPFSVSAVMLIEGCASGFIGTFMVMQYQKARSRKLNA